MKFYSEMVLQSIVRSFDSSSDKTDSLSVASSMVSSVSKWSSSSFCSVVLLIFASLLLSWLQHQC